MTISPTLSPTGTIDADTIAGNVVDQLDSAWAANDADRFADLYTADATVVITGGVHLSGREDIRRFMTAGYSGPMGGSHTTNRIESARLVASGVVVLVSVSAIVMAGETEVPADRHRRATWVLADIDGAWLIAAYSNCPI
ncbi:MAG: hypothetical protein JWM34_9 [Ilumatobacteraceae bacterium]|nr:hypothetical protein [Ilumatobacteraceae bacterium]